MALVTTILWAKNRDCGVERTASFFEPEDEKEKKSHYIQAMFRKRPDVDIIHDVLQAALAAYPASKFIQSLSHQYMERGGLSKKQLEGLLGKVAKLDTIPSSKIATLEAEILKRPTRYKSAPPPPTPLYKKDQQAGEWITAILSKYPQHKRVLFLQTKYENNEVLSPPELAELKKFHSLLKNQG